jgi:hypothetical protein
MDFFRGAGGRGRGAKGPPGQGISPEPTFYLPARVRRLFPGPVSIIVGEGGGHVADV